MSLLMKYLPEHHFAERHSIDIEGDAESVLAVACRFKLTDDPQIGWFVRLRELPARWSGRTTAAAPFGMETFTLLERTQAEVAYGLIGRFWRPDLGLEEVADCDAFMANGRPGMAKLVMVFEAASLRADVTRLTTQTRIFCPDGAARRKMGLYWLVIRPVSGLMRRRMLGLIKARAETLR
jgi:hypothetical protein